MYTIASLSEQGWVSDARGILNYVMSCYILTDAAQTVVFSGNLKSLPATYHLHINDPDAMASAMSSDLTSMLSHYYADVDVRTSVKPVNGKHVAIGLQTSVITHDGERLDLAKVLEIDSQSLRKIIEVNNYGDVNSILSSIV